MDWPLAGALTALALCAAGGGYAVVTMIQSDAPPPKASTKQALLLPRADLPAMSVQADGKPPPLPFLLNGIVGPFEVPLPKSEPAAPSVAVALPQPKDPSSITNKGARPTRSMSAAVADDPPEAAQANKPVPAQPVAVPDRWRVVATEKASYFNLGGHINRSGIVDSLASSHLKDAFKTHRNFSRLPADIRNHIQVAQNIDLTLIAPYRGLLGINDKVIEQEQAVRFERVSGGR